MSSLESFKKNPLLNASDKNDEFAGEKQRLKTKSSHEALAPHDSFDNPPSLPNYHEKNFAWDKKSPKTSLHTVMQSHTATPFVLNMVEVMHWAPAVPSIATSFTVMYYHDVWLTTFHSDVGRVLLWLLFPIVQFVATLPPIVHHTYEDWQVAPSVDPSSDNYDISDHVNERLRRVSYSLFFSMLGIASAMGAHAYFGWDMSLVTLGLLVYSILGDKDNIITKYLGSKERELNVLPLPVSVAVFFIYCQIGLTAAIVDLALGCDDIWLSLSLVLSQAFAILGGYIEGLSTETKFNQYDHLSSGFIFFGAAALQTWSMHQLGESLLKI